jgi:hypothetical protein
MTEPATISFENGGDVDYRKYTEGKLDPYHGKTIKHLIAKHRDYLVYLDEQLYVWWSIKDSYKPEATNLASFGEVLNRVSSLEAIEVSNLSEKQVAAYRRMLGEAVARLLDTQNPEQSHAILHAALEYITLRNSENGRLKYLAGSFGATIVVMLSVAVFWATKGGPSPPSEAAHVVLGMAAGAAGALMSILLRVNAMSFDASASAKLYYVEGAAKIFAGIIGALLVGVGIKGKIIFGNITAPESQLPLIILFGIVAGASERFVPGIVKQIEGRSFGDYSSKPRRGKQTKGD